MLHADWLTYIRDMEREIASRPSDAPKRARAITPMTSPAQRRALGQTRNAVRAIYQEPNEWNGALIRPQGRSVPFTTDIGGNCEKDIPHGKDTRSRR